ncbi:flagellar hook-length control protein FliK [Paracoccus stylophorae]|uniref:Flagellar hook-length control protein FliK n=1 Tax=Paracoccus stylophorae TaxID=659350 RepID=A0ABY7SWY3_9RHOB|nr:flagellar hook-length control protein FliK [Paracoccus stylophorae]WCR11359.1 flagellar hook-length control protein FliK [Paracoccus stylophorae]
MIASEIPRKMGEAVCTTVPVRPDASAAPSGEGGTFAVDVPHEGAVATEDRTASRDDGQQDQTVMELPLPQATEADEEAIPPATSDAAPTILAGILETWSGVSGSIGARRDDAPPIRAPVTEADVLSDASLPNATDESERTGLFSAIDCADVDSETDEPPGVRLTKPEPTALTGRDPLLGDDRASRTSILPESLDAGRAPVAPLVAAETARPNPALAEWRPVAAQAVIRQVADAVVTLGGDRLEIALSPEELGRVRLVVTAADRAPHVTVWIERPEVMDLVRRHAGLLMQHLAEAGLAGAELDFRDERSNPEGHPDRAGRDRQDTHHATTILGPASPGSVAAISVAAAGTLRIDIRL